MTSGALSAVMDSGFSACPSGSSQNPRIHWIANLDFAASNGSVCVMLKLCAKCVFGGRLDQLARAVTIFMSEYNADSLPDLGNTC